MRVFFLLLLEFIAWINLDKAFAEELQQIRPLEKVVILIELNDSAIEDSVFLCETVSELLTNSNKSPWGLLFSFYASCNSKDKEFNQVQPHELWKLKVVGNAKGASWRILRPLNLSELDKKKALPAAKIEAAQILNASIEARQIFYESENSLRIMLASLAQQVPFFQNTSVVNKNTDNDLVPLPVWSGEFRNVYACISGNWKLFSVYLSTASSEKRKACMPQNTWNVALVQRGSLTKPMAELMALNLKTINEEVGKSKNQPKPLKKRSFGLALLGGGTNYYTNLAFGNLRELSFAGTTATLLVDYYGLPLFSRKKTIQTNISLAINWHSLSSPIFIKKNNTERTLSLNALYMRCQTGINMDFFANYRLVFNPFFDYGLYGKYTITGGTTNNEYSYKNSMRYGAIMSGEYRFDFGLKAGFSGNVLLGSFSLDKQDEFSNNKKTSLWGFAENIYVGWNL